MIRKLLLIIFCLSSLYSEKIIIYTDNNFKPYSYVENRTLEGINIEILKSIFSKIKDYSLELRAIDWEEGLKKLKNKEIKILSGTYYRPKERPYIKDYSKAFMYDEPTIFCNKKIKKNPIWPKDFLNLKISKPKGNSISVSSEYKQAIKDGNLKIIEDTTHNNIINLINNKIDCLILPNISMKGLILQKLKNRYKEENSSIKEVMKLPKFGVHIGFSGTYFPEKKDLIKKINLAIKIMQNSKEIDEIINKHLDIYLHPKRKRKISVSLYNWGEKLVSDRLEGYGIIPQIITSAFKDRNIEVNYNFYHYKYAYLLTKWGKKCMSVPWLDIGERAEYFYFSENIKSIGTYLFYNKNLYPDGINNDIEQYRVGGIQGYYYEKEFFYKHKTIYYKSFKDWESAIKALLSQDIDVIFAQKDRFEEHLKQFLPREQTQISFHKKPIKIEKNYAIFSKNCEDSNELRDEFNIGFKNIKENGIFNQILNQYNMTLAEFNSL